MKKTIVNGICLLLMAVAVWQCTPSEYKLVDFKDMGWKYVRHDFVLEKEHPIFLSGWYSGFQD